VNVPAGWQPLRQPRLGREGFVTTPFARLARTHALAAAGDALVAMALADSLFFSIPTGDARGKVALYLLLTMAPFAVVGPLIGPAIDRARGGRRWMVILSAVSRAVICALMIDDVDSVLLFPEAFALLVLSKGYAVAKSALVPTTVRSDTELVQANSKLQLLSGVMGFVAAVPGVALSKLAGPAWVLGLAALVHGVGAVVAFRLPHASVAVEPVDAAERAELRSAGILWAASAMGLLRGVVGFLTFLLAFDLRGGDAPAWHFGVVLAASVAGGLVGAVVAPALRRSAREEVILTAVLVLTGVVGLGSAWVGGLSAAAVLGLVVGAASTAGKLAFDAIVQRDAPDANRGRSFARFESRFQVIWVAGAFLPVVVHVPSRLGYLVIAGGAGFGAFSYWAGERTARRFPHHRPPSPVKDRLARIDARRRLAARARRRPT
jgi:hypothetical protein